MRPAPSLALLYACALSTVAVWSANADAAGINCAKAKSKNETAICTDPVLTQRDGELSQAYRDALKTSKYSGDLKQDQLSWIKERDRCDGQVRCLRRAYVERLVELKPAAIAGKFDWNGDWTRADGTSSLTVKTAGANKNGAIYIIELQASSGANTGLLSGRAHANGDNEMTYKGSGDNAKCELTFHRYHRQIQVEQQHTGSDCGAGQGVYFSGRYLPGIGEAVTTTQWNLLDLGVVLKPENDERLRKLLGDDYAALVDRLDVIDSRADGEGLGATVTNGYVRGLASDMRALLIQTEAGKFWVAIRAENKQNKPELRYYSNDPAWVAKLPATVDTWSDGYQEQVPVRLMSAGGRVLSNP